MVWFLIVTALLFAWLCGYAEASILGLALLPIAGMDAYLHRRTQATTESLAGRLAASARMVRGGAVKDIPAGELVVPEGSAFPGDGILVAGTNLQSDESALTGEAMPVRKHAFQGKPRNGNISIDNQFWGAAGTRLLTPETGVRNPYRVPIKSETYPIRTLTVSTFSARGSTHPPERWVVADSG